MNQTTDFTGSLAKNFKVRITGVVLTALIVGFAAYSISNEYFKHWAQRKLAAAVVAFDKNEVDAAIALADEVLAKDPDNVKALLTKAVALAQKGSLEFREEEYGMQALGLAQKVLQMEPENIEALRIVGYSNEIMQQYEEAHTAYERAIELDPGNVLVIVQNAHAYMLQGDSNAAEEGYRRALEINPELPEANMGLARSLAGLDEIDDSIRLYESIVQTASNARVRAEAAYSAGMKYRVKEDFDSAEKYFRLATTIDETYALGWMGLAGLQFSRSLDLLPTAENRSEKEVFVTESFAYLQKALALNPNQASAHFQLGIQLIAIGNIDQGILILEKTKSVIPEDITLTSPEKPAMIQRIDSAIENARIMQKVTAEL